MMFSIVWPPKFLPLIGSLKRKSPRAVRKGWRFDSPF